MASPGEQQAAGPAYPAGTHPSQPAAAGGEAAAAAPPAAAPPEAAADGPTPAEPLHPTPATVAQEQLNGHGKEHGPSAEQPKLATEPAALAPAALAAAAAGPSAALDKPATAQPVPAAAPPEAAAAQQPAARDALAPAPPGADAGPGAAFAVAPAGVPAAPAPAAAQQPAAVAAAPPVEAQAAATEPVAGAAQQVAGAASGGPGAEQAAAAEQDFELPTMPEEKHAQKPTWRRGYQAYHKTEYLFVTLTPSDCTTRRLRPPREWYDGLLGANVQNFVVGAQAPDGTAVSFLLKSHAYEYVKAEYYVQGGEAKRLFKVLRLQPGDALKFVVSGKASGIPSVRLTVIPAARNPHAAAILANAADQAAKREARLAANPKGPKGAVRKRKKGADDDDDDDEGYEGDPSGGIAAGRRSRQRSRKHFGEDFVSGLDEAWAAAQNSEDESEDYELAHGDGPRRRAGSRSTIASTGLAWLAANGGAEQQQQSGSALVGGGVPEVVATGVAEGRNVLRIKINRPAPAGAHASAGKPGEAAGGGGGSARSRGDPAGCPLNFLAGLAGDVATPMAQQGGAMAEPGTAKAVGAGAAPEPVMLLSKKLLRDEAGAVNGAMCKLGWEKGSRSTVQISRALSQFGAAHHDTAAVETFDQSPDQCLLELTLRLQPPHVGRVDVLENAVVQLLDAL